VKVKAIDFLSWGVFFLLVHDIQFDSRHYALGIYNIKKINYLHNILYFVIVRLHKKISLEPLFYLVQTRINTMNIKEKNK